MTKVVKEFLLDNATGEVSVEYDDNSTSKYNLADAVTATQSPQGVVGFPTVGGKTLHGPTLYRRPIVSRCFASSYATVDNSSNLATYVQAIALPCKFDALQIGYVHLGGAGAVTGLKALVAGTDDIGDMTLTNTTGGKKFVTPRRGGVEKNTMTQDGWQAVTWGGAASPTIADPGAGNTTIAWSDVIPCEGIEDASHPGMYAALVRLFPGNGFFTRCSFVGFSDPAKYLADCGSNYVLGANRGGSDSVTTLANWANATTAAFGDSSVLPLIVIGYTGTRRRVFMMVGDSRFASAAPSEASAYAYRNASFKTEQSLLAKGYKTTLISCSMGGQTVGTYQTRALQYMQQATPDVAVYLVYSINDGSQTAALCAAARAKCLAFVDRCAALGVQPVLVSQFPTTGGYGSGYAAAVALDAWVAELGLPWMSPLQIYGNGTNGDWATATKWNEDANHLTPAGYADLASRIDALVGPLL